jgi:dolichyl-phosphate beta-glucosyltransferase
LSVVVPAFNEEARLPDLLVALRATTDPLTTEIVVVDDGSEDRTTAIAELALADMPLARVLRLETNRGKGAAVRAGVLESRGRIVAYMDADLATDLASLGVLTAALGDADVSIGSRAHDASVVERARLDRTILGRTFNLMTRVLTRFDHLDTQCGFKAFHAPVAKLLLSMSRVDGFAFDVEILHLAHKLGLRVAEVPVHWQHVDGSKIRPFSDSFRMTADTIRATSRQPRLELSGLELVGQSRSAIANALDQLDEAVLVGWNTASVVVLLPMAEPSATSRLADHFGRFGMSVRPVSVSCADLLGQRRKRRLSLGLPSAGASTPASRVSGVARPTAR